MARHKGRGLQIVSTAGRDALPAEVRRALATSTPKEKARFAREAKRQLQSLDADLDRVIEMIAAKRVSQDLSPVAAVLTDDALLRVGERVMERLLNEDRGQYVSGAGAGVGSWAYECMILTEAAFALNAEAERRGLAPHESVRRLRARVAEHEAQFRAARRGQTGDAS